MLIGTRGRVQHTQGTSSHLEGTRVRVVLHLSANSLQGLCHIVGAEPLPNLSAKVGTLQCDHLDGVLAVPDIQELPQDLEIGGVTVALYPPILCRNMIMVTMTAALHKLHLYKLP